jgi:hypothetical protein
MFLSTGKWVTLEVSTEKTMYKLHATLRKRISLCKLSNKFYKGTWKPQNRGSKKTCTYVYNKHLPILPSVILIN